MVKEDVRQCQKKLISNRLHQQEDENCKFHQQTFHNKCIIVWCGTSRAGIIGPYFFSAADCLTVSDIWVISGNAEQLSCFKTEEHGIRWSNKMGHLPALLVHHCHSWRACSYIISFHNLQMSDGQPEVCTSQDLIILEIHLIICLPVKTKDHSRLTEANWMKISLVTARKVM